MAFRQTRHALPAGFQGLNILLAIFAQPKRHFALRQRALGGVEVLVKQRHTLPAVLATLFNQRMLLEAL